MPSSAAISSPRRSGSGGPSRCQSSAAADHLAGQVEVGLDHLGAGDRPGAAGGEAVGDGEQGDVDGDRFGGPQVLVDAARRQRRVADHEAEPQVMEGQRLQVAGQLARGAQAAHDLADRPHPLDVVAFEADEAVAFGPGRGLGDVVEEGAEAQGDGAVHLVGERLGEVGGGLVGALGADEARQVGLDLQRVLEHLERVAVHVEVVVGALFDALRPLQLGEDDGGEAELVEQLEAAQRVGAAEQLAQLGQLALAGGLGGARRRRRGRARRCRGRSAGSARRRAAPRAAAAAGRR